MGATATAREGSWREGSVRASSERARSALVGAPVEERVESARVGSARVGSARGGSAGVALPAAPGSIFISPLLGVLADILERVSQVVDDGVRPPEHQEGGAEQQADEDVAPEGGEAEAQAVDDEVSAAQGDGAVAGGGPDGPAPEGVE